MDKEKQIREKTFAKAAQAAVLRNKGRSDVEIAAMLKVSPRTVFNWKRLKRDQAQDLAHGYAAAPEPTSLSYSNWVQARLNRPPGDTPELKTEEFKTFFDEFANRRGGLRPHNEDWVRRAFESDRVLLNCPPRHAKSTVFSVFLPLWLVSQNRNINIIIGSASDASAKKWLREIADHMVQNLALIHAFGRYKPEGDEAAWRPLSGQITVVGRDALAKTGDFTIESRGKGQQFLGKGADWIIIDDAAEAEDVYSDLSRQRVSDWFHERVMSRLEPEEGSTDEASLGHVIVIGQRLHLWDLYGELKEEKVEETGEPVWYHLNYQAILDWEKQETLWPEKFPYKRLMRSRAGMGSRAFETMYQQNPLPEGAGLATRAMIMGTGDYPGCVEEDRDGWEPHTFEPGMQYVRVISVDPAQSERGRAAIIIGDVPKEDFFELYVIAIYHQYMPPTGKGNGSMVEIVGKLVDRFGCDVLIWEQNNAQGFLLQSMDFMPVRSKIGSVIGHQTGHRNKGDARSGLLSLTTEFELGHIHLPYGDAEGRTMSQLLIEEALTHPQSLWDDVLMSLWFTKFNKSSLYLRFYNIMSEGKGPTWDTPRRLDDGWKF